MADDGPGVLPFVRGIDLSKNDFHVSFFMYIFFFYFTFCAVMFISKSNFKADIFCVYNNKGCEKKFAVAKFRGSKI